MINVQNIRLMNGYQQFFILLIFNTTVFFFASFLGMLNIEASFAFGLFAVFALLRYRTQQIPIFEMTFLFVSIIFAIINSTVTESISIADILLADLLILFVSTFAGRLWGSNGEKVKIITYEKIELITPDKKAELKADLIERTGLKIVKTEVVDINFLTDTATIRVYY